MSVDDTTDLDDMTESESVVAEPAEDTNEMETSQSDESLAGINIESESESSVVNDSTLGATDLPLKDILEGALLAASQPLSMERLLSLFEEDEKPNRAVMQEVIQELMVDYESRGFELVESATGYRFQVRSRVGKWVARLWDEKPQRYSRALLETIALIAYRQPITRGDIEDIRGVAVSSHIIKTLLEREWVRIVGHRDVPGRPAMYATTKHFLDYFNLTSLDELPDLAEIKNLDSPVEDELADGEERTLEDQLSVPERIEQRPESEIKALAENELQTAEAINSAVEHNAFERPREEQEALALAASGDTQDAPTAGDEDSNRLSLSPENSESAGAAGTSASSFASLLNKHGFGQQGESGQKESELLSSGELNESPESPENVEHDVAVLLESQADEAVVTEASSSSHQSDNIVHTDGTEVVNESHVMTIGDSMADRVDNQPAEEVAESQSTELLPDEMIDKAATSSKVLGSDLPGTEELIHHELLNSNVAKTENITEVKAAEAAKFLAEAEKLAADLSWDDEVIITEPAPSSDDATSNNRLDDKKEESDKA